VKYSVFTQTPSGRFELATLVRNAKNFFSIELEVLEVSAASVPDTSDLVRLRVSKPNVFRPSIFRVARRPVSQADLTLAELAEQRGRAAGMSELAKRCPHLWEIESESTQNTQAEQDTQDPVNADLALYGLCAILASVALGPVLPTDGSTLFGVRGAIERLDKGQPRLRR
jgi:hypothetical protein